MLTSIISSKLRIFLAQFKTDLVAENCFKAVRVKVRKLNLAKYFRSIVPEDGDRCHQWPKARRPNFASNCELSEARISTTIYLVRQ